MKATETITIEGVEIELQGTWSDDEFEVESATVAPNTDIYYLLESTLTARKFVNAIGKIEEGKREQSYYQFKNAY